jgi:hypothetical protein
MDQTQQMMRLAMRGVAILVVPLTAKFEAGVHVYWLTSNGLAVLQASTGIGACMGGGGEDTVAGLIGSLCYRDAEERGPDRGGI